MAASLAVLCRRGREGAVSLLCAVSYGEGEGAQVVNAAVSVMS